MDISSLFLVIKYCLRSEQKALNGIILCIDKESGIKTKNLEDLIENADGEISNSLTKKVLFTKNSFKQ